MSLDYSEVFCESVDTIIKKRLETISFDQTVVCTIIDDKDRDKGHYIVSNGDTKFDAYCENKDYNKDEQVQVLIPKGDLSEPQKTIISRYSINAKDMPVTYVKPFNNLVLMTKDLIDEESSEKKEFSILANKNRNIFNDLEKPKNEIIIFQKSLMLMNTYTSIGVKASFKNLFSNYELIKGEFGLCFRIKNEKDKEYNFYLSSKEMFGNPYAFIAYITQEKEFNIMNLDINYIKEISIILYEDDNFQEKNNNFLMYPDIEKQIDNIYVKDIQLYFANDIKIKPNDRLEIYCKDNQYDNKKNAVIIENVWYHKNNKTNEYIGYQDSSINNYSLQWYLLKNGEWEKFSSSIIKDWDKPMEIFLLTSIKNTQVKAILMVNDHPYESNILNFNNTSINDNALSTDKSLALSISLGKDAKEVYPFYDANNILINENEAILNRELRLTYNPSQLNITEQDFFEKASITWYLPIGTNTMLSYDKDFLLSKDIIQSEKSTIDFIAFKYKNNINLTPNFYFQIKNHYNPNATNNIIKCVATYDDVDYITQRTFNFISYENKDNNYKVIITPKNNIKNFNTQQEEIPLEVKLYAPDSTEIMLPDTLENTPVSWTDINGNIIKDRYINNNPNLFNFNCKQLSFNYIKANIKIGNNSYVSDIFSLPYSNNKNYYAVVPNIIEYNAFGVPSYSKDKLKIINAITGLPVQIDGNDYIHWNIKYINLKTNKEIFNNDLSQVLPSLQQNNTDYYLKAPNLYTSNINIGTILIAEDKNKNILWAQSILIISNFIEDQNNSSNNNIQLNEKEKISNIIVGLSKQNQDQQLSSVFIGNILPIEKDKKDSIFGFFGYKDNKKYWHFDIDGNIFLGNPDNGQIIANENQTTLFSKDKKININLTKNNINIFDKNNNYFSLTEEGKQLAIKTDDFDFCSNNFYIRNQPYPNQTDFINLKNKLRYGFDKGESYLLLNNTIINSSELRNVIIDSEKGRIGGWNYDNNKFYVQGKNDIYISSLVDPYIIQIKEVSTYIDSNFFAVDKDGTAYLKKPYIYDGFKIQEGPDKIEFINLQEYKKPTYNLENTTIQLKMNGDGIGNITGGVISGNTVSGQVTIKNLEVSGSISIPIMKEGPEISIKYLGVKE